jgi:inner membrane transporter RhtA
MGAVVTAPFALVSIGTVDVLTWQLGGLAITVAVMCSVLPYSLELIALRSLSPETMAILVCLSPVIAAIAGRLVLGQALGLLGYLAIVLVTAASAGAVRSAHPRALPSG